MACEITPYTGHMVFVCQTRILFFCFSKIPGGVIF